MTAAVVFALGSLAVAAALVLVRLLRGPTAADRVVALDALLALLMGGLAVRAVSSGDTQVLRLLVVVALVGFVGTVFAARFVERRGQ